MTHFKNKRYARAIDNFQKVRSEFPFAPQVIPAELKLAESYYLNKQYPEAIAAFKEFQSLHPTNENIPLVVYHLGLAHFDQFTSIDRDQRMTEIAKSYFESVLRDYPKSPYASDAKEKLAQCLGYLAESEFNIASFYLREKKYPAAIERLEGILRRYPNTVTAPKALFYLGEGHRLDKHNVKAALAYEALIRHYPENPLTKTAQAHLGELAKEKQDPLAMLLKRDGRPAFAPPPGQEIQNPKSKIENEKELNLVAKKEVVHEEPGDEKGIFRRVIDTLNPFASSSKKKEERDDKKIETAKDVREPRSNEESDGFFSSVWRGLNPFAKKESKTKIEAIRDPQLVTKVDASLKEKGIAAPQNPEFAIQNPKSKIQNLEAEAPTPPPAVNTEVILGEIDSKLKKEGKNVAGLPPPPEAAPVLRATSAKETKPATPKVETSLSPSARGLIADIDETLKRKGIEPAKLETTRKTEAPGREASGVRREQPQEKIELAPRLAPEKGPFFIDPKEYRAQEAEKESEPKEKAQTEKPAEPLKELPQAVVKGPPQPVKEKPTAAKPADKKKEERGDEEGKGALDQLREDLEKLRNLLNPFGW